MSWLDTTLLLVNNCVVCVFNVDPPVNVPLNVDINQFTSSSVSISWTKSSSDCVTGYRYNVSSVNNQVLDTTSNSPGIVLR